MERELFVDFLMWTIFVKGTPYMKPGIMVSEKTTHTI